MFKLETIKNDFNTYEQGVKNLFHVDACTVFMEDANNQGDKIIGLNVRAHDKLVSVFNKYIPELDGTYALYGHGRFIYSSHNGVVKQHRNLGEALAFYGILRK